MTLTHSQLFMAIILAELGHEFETFQVVISRFLVSFAVLICDHFIDIQFQIDRSINCWQLLSFFVCIRLIQ